MIPGLRPTLYHNNHNWQGDDPIAFLLQGTGALAILVALPLPLNEPRPDGVVSWMVLLLYAFAILFYLVRVYRGGDITLPPWTMNVPLLVLGAGALFAGLGFRHLFIGADDVSFWRDSIVLPHAHHDVPFWLTLSPTLAMTLGFLIAWYCYMWRPLLPFGLLKRFPATNQFFLHAWYFDALYDFLFVRPAMWLGTFLWRKGDGGTIDGFLNGLAMGFVPFVTRLAGRAQSGYLFHYAFAMVLGLVFLMLWLGGGRGGWHPGTWTRRSGGRAGADRTAPPNRARRGASSGRSAREGGHAGGGGYEKGLGAPGGQPPPPPRSCRCRAAPTRSRPSNPRPRRWWWVRSSDHRRRLRPGRPAGRRRERGAAVAGRDARRRASAQADRAPPRRGRGRLHAALRGHRRTAAQRRQSRSRRRQRALRVRGMPQSQPPPPAPQRAPGRCRTHLRARRPAGPRSRRCDAR